MDNIFVRIVWPALSFAAAMAAIVVSLHGGPQGVRGPAGPQGAQGSTGATGPQGPAGQSAPVLGYQCQMLFPFNGVETTGYWPCSNKPLGG